MGTNTKKTMEQALRLHFQVTFSVISDIADILSSKLIDEYKSESDEFVFTEEHYKILQKFADYTTEEDYKRFIHFNQGEYEKHMRGFINKHE